MQNRAAAITDFIHGCDASQMPADVLHMARRCVLDTLGIWASGIATDPSQIARNHAARRYPGALPMPFDGRAVNPIGFAFAGQEVDKSTGAPYAARFAIGTSWPDSLAS